MLGYVIENWMTFKDLCLPDDITKVIPGKNGFMEKQKEV